MLKKLALIAAGALILALLPISIPKGEPAFAADSNSIMGSSQLTGAQMAQWFRAKRGGLWKAEMQANLDTVANLYISEGALEGIRGDVAFAQAIKETGWFYTFSANCALKNNYSGIGATGACSQTAYNFVSPQEGIRAQIHQLRNYADSTSVTQFTNYPKNSRDTFVYKGQVTTWQGLNGKWAVPGNGYGESILSTYNEMLGYFGMRGYCSEASPISQQTQGTGYWVITDDGGVFTYGSAQGYGAGNAYIRNRVTAAFGTPTGRGYTMITNDGGVFTFGDAQAYGAGNTWIRNTVTAAFPTPTGRGYTMVTNDGGVFTFGDAQAYGAGNTWIRNTVVAAFGTPNGGGYTMVTNDGGVFTFGNAQAYGAANIWVKNGITSAAGTSNGGGYWMTSTDGGLFTFGNAQALGNINTCGGQIVTNIQGTSTTGYRMLTSTGKVFSFGNARHYGPSHLVGNTAVALIPIG